MIQVLDQKKGENNEEKLHRKPQSQEKQPGEILWELVLEGQLELAQQNRAGKAFQGEGTVYAEGLEV